MGCTGRRAQPGDSSTSDGLQGAACDASAAGASRAIDVDLLRTRPLSPKLKPPRPDLPLVTRRALLATLAECSAPLVVVSAPAGAGKTICLLEWVDADPRPVAWVTLDRADDDRVVFLYSLVRALDPVTALEPDLLDLLQLHSPPVEEQILPRLAAALGRAAPFVLVLDDAHRLRSAPCWSVVRAVLDALPPGAQLALGTRRDPPLRLAALRARGAVLEIRAGDLAFDREEASRLLGEHDEPPDGPTLDAVMHATEGWAAGLYLATLAGRTRGRERDAGGRLRELGGDQREIAEYLATEVLEGQAPDVQEFLLRTSVLEHAGTAECRALTGREDAHEMLARLAGENLFVVPLGAGAYRYHHLFAEFLRAELRRRAPDEARRLHQTAADWFCEEGDVDQAVHHWLAAGDVDQAAATVTSAWPRMWNRGQIETVRRWLQGFTDEQILERPALTLCAGWVLTALSDTRLGRRWGQAACSAHVGDEPSPDGAVSLRSSQALLRANLGLDGVKRMRADAELAAELESRPGTSWYADAQGALGVARWLSGAERHAEAALQRTVREGEVSNPSAELAALGTLALIAADRGDWDAAREFADRAAALLEACGFGTGRRSLPMLLARADLLAREGDPEVVAVEGRAARVLETMVPHPWLTLLASVVLGETMLEHGDVRAAQGWSRRAAELLRHYSDSGILGPRAERLRRSVEAASCTDALTAAEHRVLEFLPTHMSDAQIGEHLFITRNTVKSHLRAVYRKLGVASRDEAVARARGLGLLRKP
ncbi:MAG: hypothetical protein JW767_01520 [Thermoleophilia bacterium]|nr:hypothetical protein [Thermoleophilia bacterium]